MSITPWIVDWREGASTGDVMMPGLLSPPQAGDLLILMIESWGGDGQGDVPHPPPGASDTTWTLVDHAISGTAVTSDTRLTVYQADYESGTYQSYIYGEGDHTQVAVFSVRSDWGRPILETVTTGAASSGSWDHSRSGPTTQTGKALVVLCGSHGDNVSTNSQSNSTLEDFGVEFDELHYSGNDSCLFVFRGAKNVPGDSGTFEWSSSTSEKHAAVMFSLVPPSLGVVWGVSDVTASGVKNADSSASITHYSRASSINLAGTGSIGHTQSVTASGVKNAEGISFQPAWFEWENTGNDDYFWIEDFPAGFPDPSDVGLEEISLVARVWRTSADNNYFRAGGLTDKTSRTSWRLALMNTTIYLGGYAANGGTQSSNLGSYYEPRWTKIRFDPDGGTNQWKVYFYYSTEDFLEPSQVTWAAPADADDFDGSYHGLWQDATMNDSTMGLRVGSTSGLAGWRILWFGYYDENGVLIQDFDPGLAFPHKTVGSAWVQNGTPKMVAAIDSRIIHSASVTASGVAGGGEDYVGTGAIAHTHSVTASGQVALSGSGSAAHTQSAAAVGDSQRSGTGSAAHTQAATASGNAFETASGSGSVAHTQAATASGDAARDGAGSAVHGDTAAASGDSARSGAGSVVHTQAAVAAGSPSDTETISFAHTHSVVASGQAAASGASSVAHTQAATASGDSARSGVGSVAHTQAASGSGSALESIGGAGSVAHTQAAVASGVSARSDVGAVGHTQAAVSSGDALQVASGSGSIVHTGALSGSGSIAVEGAASVGHTQAATASGDPVEIHAGSGTVPHVASLAGVAATGRSGTGTVAHTATVPASAGTAALSGSGTVAHSTAASAAGSAEWSGAATVAEASSVTVAGSSDRSGSGSVTCVSDVTADGIAVGGDVAFILVPSLVTATGGSTREGGGAVAHTQGTVASGVYPRSGVGSAAVSTSAVASGDRASPVDVSMSVVSGVSATGVAAWSGSGSVTHSESSSGVGESARSGDGAVAATSGASASGEGINAGEAVASHSSSVSASGVSARSGAGSAAVTSGVSAASAGSASGDGSIVHSLSDSGEGTSSRSGSGLVTHVTGTASSGAAVSGSDTLFSHSSSASASGVATRSGPAVIVVVASLTGLGNPEEASGDGLFAHSSSMAASGAKGFAGVAVVALSSGVKVRAKVVEFEPVTTVYAFNRAKVIELREAKGWTRGELAEAINHRPVTPQAVFRWENGMMMPTSKDARRLASALGVNVDVLYHHASVVSPATVVYAPRPVSAPEAFNHDEEDGVFAFDAFKLRQVREAKGWERDDLAALVNVSAQDLHFWEDGVATPTKMQVTRMAEALALTVDSLYFDVTEATLPLA